MKTTKAFMMILTAVLTSFAYAAGPAQNPAQGSGTTPAVAPLTDAEIAHILYMREEEKLARDVYLVLSEIWDCPVFANISAAEQRHMDATGLLITKYNLEDPVGDDVPGVFQDGHLAGLYADLMLEIEGQTSLLEALDVGRRIEEEDIADLNAALEEITARDVEWVFENLLRGSTNHLSAFTRLIANGGTCPATTCWRQAASNNQQTQCLAAQGRGGRGGKGGQGNGNGQGTRQRKRDGSGQQDRQRKRDGSCVPAATI
jgi:hypothetical protein